MGLCCRGRCCYSCFGSVIFHTQCHRRAQRESRVWLRSPVTHAEAWHASVESERETEIGLKPLSSSRSAPFLASQAENLFVFRAYIYDRWYFSSLLCSCQTSVLTASKMTMWNLDKLTKFCLTQCTFGVWGCRTQTAVNEDLAMRFLSYFTIYYQGL